MTPPRDILLIEPPSFPKGVLSLSVPAIAAAFGTEARVIAVDLNVEALPLHSIARNRRLLFAGLKVSCQNVEHAARITQELRAVRPDLPVVWGGEYPSLLPEQALERADCAVSGAIEPVAARLLSDLTSGAPQRMYVASGTDGVTTLRKPDYSVIRRRDRYLKSMGVPMETSRGCDRRCTFCMVHVMQPSRHFKSSTQLHRELAALGGEFVNVIDYNLGMNRAHLLNVARAFAKSNVRGWMGEMCLETLDDDALLERLAASRCRIVYCGLESVSESELRSVNKARTNDISTYERVIRKTQAHGIQVAAGVIVGLQGVSPASLDRTFAFYAAMGLIYAKITFLLFNPGTRVHRSMARLGSYLTDRVDDFDGNHFTFAYPGAGRAEIAAALGRNIRSFYAMDAARRRARAAGVTGEAAEAFADLNRIYRTPYFQWLRYGALEDGDGFARLLSTPFRKSGSLRRADANAYTLRS